MTREMAYLVGFLDKEKGTFEGCGVFSEHCPTVRSNLWPFTLCTGRGDNYQSALDDLREILLEPWWHWVHKHLDNRSLQSLKWPVK